MVTSVTVNNYYIIIVNIYHNCQPKRRKKKINIISYYPLKTRGMLLLTKKFKMLCGFSKHAVKLRMHKAAPYAFPIPLNTF